MRLASPTVAGIDDVVTIELRAVAGLTIPLVDNTFTPDRATSVIDPGTSNTNNPFLSSFPHLGTPGGRYQAVPGTGTGVTNHHPAPPENPYAGQGAVPLDIGGDVGALVVRMPSDMDGVEIEIGPTGAHHNHDHHHHGQSDHSHPTHVAVVARPTQAGQVHSLVYPELTAGRYQLWRKPAGPVTLQVDVRGGEVTETEWPTTAF